MTDDAALISRPFAPAHAVRAEPGQTVQAILTQAINADQLAIADLPFTVVYLNGEPLLREAALPTVVAEGDLLHVVIEPQSGGGGGKKNAGQVIFQLAVMVAAFAIAGPAGSFAGGLFGGSALAVQLGGALASAAVLTAGQLIGAAIFKPESQGGASGDRYALQNASNQYRPWASMPLALGAVVVAPDLAVKTYTSAVGDDIYIHGILGLHYGPCTLSDMRIGDTLVSSLPAGEIVTVEHLTPGPRTFSLYPNDSDQLNLQDELNRDGSTAVVHAAGSEGQRFELDLFLPEGLYFAKDDGRVETADASVTVRSRAIDEYGAPTGSWVDAGTTSTSNRTREPVRLTHVVDRALGHYEFEIKRNAADGNTKRHDTVVLTAIRAIAFRKPIVDETLSIIEFKVKASALNQGTLAPITCRIEPICDIYDGVNWAVSQATSNPAALTRWLLTGPAPAKPLDEDQADTGLSGWYDICADNDWTCGLYLTDMKSQRDAMKLIEGTGRASLYWDGRRIVAACWAERPAPTQIFTGRNLANRSGSIVYPEVVHGLRVEFANIDQRGEADEIIVYAEGFGAVAGTGVVAATRLEAWRVEGQCTRTRAMLDGIWELNRRRLQRRVETWSTDVEHLTCSFGDRVGLSWRAVSEGLGEARVRARRYSGGLVVGLRLDQPVEMEAGVDYAADLRIAPTEDDEAQLIRGVDLVTAPGASREIAFATPRAEDDCPAPGDLIAWGVAGSVSSDLEIVGIEPGENLTARLTGRKYVAPALMAAEAAAGLAGPSTLTGQRRAVPPKPILLGSQGSASGVRVSFSIPPWSGSPITQIAARWRITPEDDTDGGWTDLPPLGAAVRTLVTPAPRMLPDGGEIPDATVDVELIVVTASGQFSEPLVVSAVSLIIDPGAPEIFAPPTTFNRFFSKNIGAGVSTSVAVTTDIFTAALGSRFSIEVSGSARSLLDGSLPDANGTVGLYILKGGVEEQVGSTVTVGDDTGEATPQDLTSLGGDIDPAYAGTVQFKLKVAGGGGVTLSHGKLMGTFKMTAYV